MAVVEEVCPEKKSAFESVSLSRMTMTRRIEDLGSDLMVQLKSKASQFKMFSIATDESTDVTDIAQLLVFIRGINNSFEVTEELAAMKSIKTTTTGEDLFKEVSEIFDDLNLDWNKLTAITTDGAPSMVGRHNGLVARLRKKVLESNGSPPLDIHCIIHQQNLCGKILNLDHVMKVVTKSVNLIRSYSTNHRIFKEFLLQIEAEYGDVVYHSEIRWLSRVDVSTAPGDLQLELIELQCQTPLQDLFREKSLPDFYAALDSYPNLRNLGMKMTTAFASTYICEQTFSTLKRAKPASRARLSDDHLHSILRMNVTQLEPNIKKLVSEKQHQTSH
ncbi:general transcription factor II-I repeat domain-containing protein 2A-like [Chrysoperla carnea]|uniref:general transcription factor II-I repeat domain-containing protein 2A-like n=1 Tax=Chrysoperla carnea TaxID=189513 RepID=UPI001D097F7B|nr:general transcription factor II-I repeat domain-containing protein 2A-like [Chrysoperla carnea]